MNALCFRRRLARALVALLVLAAQSLLPALAHASPPDPAWIPGIYDDADADAMALLVSSDAGSVVRTARDDLRWPPTLLGTLGQSRASAPQTLRASAGHPRAPPAL